MPFECDALCWGFSEFPADSARTPEPLFGSGVFAFVTATVIGDRRRRVTWVFLFAGIGRLTTSATQGLRFCQCLSIHNLWLPRLTSKEIAT